MKPGALPPPAPERAKPRRDQIEELVNYHVAAARGAINRRFGGPARPWTSNEEARVAHATAELVELHLARYDETP